MQRAVASAVVATLAHARGYISRGRAQGINYLADQKSPYALHDHRYGYSKTYDGDVVEDFESDELEVYPTLKKDFPTYGSYETKDYDQVYSYDPEVLYIGYGGDYKDGGYLTRRTHHAHKIGYRTVPRKSLGLGYGIGYKAPAGHKATKVVKQQPYNGVTKDLYSWAKPEAPVRSYKPLGPKRVIRKPVGPQRLTKSIYKPVAPTKLVRQAYKPAPPTKLVRQAHRPVRSFAKPSRPVQPLHTVSRPIGPVKGPQVYGGYSAGPIPSSYNGLW